jgi:hypothetical protein
MPIGDEKITTLALLEFQPVLQRAMKMAQMKAPGGPHAANNDLSGLVNVGLPVWCGKISHNCDSKAA